MITKAGMQSVALSLEGMDVVGNGIVEQVNLTTHSPTFDCYSMGGDMKRLPRGEFEHTLDIKIRLNGKDVNTFFNTNKTKLRNKKVKDCTARELLYAARLKIKNEDK